MTATTTPPVDRARPALLASGDVAVRIEKLCRACGDLWTSSAYHLRNSVYLCASCTKDERRARRAGARAFMAVINARTFCAHCGAQPVDWHNPEHVELNRQRFRIGTMVGDGRSIAAIRAEIDRCTPLCRRCHMKEDGRLRAFTLLGKRSKTRPPKPCAECAVPSRPLRRGRCRACYDRKRRSVAREVSHAT